MNVRVVGSVATMATAVILASCTSDATRSALPSGPLGSPSVSLTSTGIAGTSGSAAGTHADTSAETSAETSSGTLVVEPSAAATSATLTSTSSTTTTTTTTTTTIPPRLVTEGAVVLVANASNVDGAAGRLTERLREVGFTLQKATDAAGIEADLESSKVYVVAGSEAVARSVAAFLGNVPLSYMPTPISIAGGPEMLGKATVVVMLGHDMAK